MVGEYCVRPWGLTRGAGKDVIRINCGGTLPLVRQQIGQCRIHVERALRRFGLRWVDFHFNNAPLNSNGELFEVEAFPLQPQ